MSQKLQRLAAGKQKGFLTALCLHPPCRPDLSCSQPTQGFSQILGSHPSFPFNLQDLQGSGAPTSRTDYPEEVEKPQRRQPPTLWGLLHAKSSTANDLRENKSNLSPGSALATGKRVLVQEDTISGQCPATLSSVSAPAQHLSWLWVPPVCPGTCPPMSSTCTQICLLTHHLRIVQAMPGQQLPPCSEQKSHSTGHPASSGKGNMGVYVTSSREIFTQSYSKGQP